MVGAYPLHLVVKVKKESIMSDEPINGITSLLNHEDGKMKVSAMLFVGCILVQCLSWMLMLGIGGGVMIAIGVIIALISLIFGIITGFGLCLLYMDWVENG